MKVYIELVLLDNFWADALVLFGTAKWMQAPYRKGRLFASAGLGTLYAVLSLMRGLVFLQRSMYNGITNSKNEVQLCRILQSMSAVC